MVLAVNWPPQEPPEVTDDTGYAAPTLATDGTLVFAIFELNPAPFCLLDEVDAPLDDINAVRFSELVKDMSDRVQFVIVSHNKITMEIADQLIGVTMNEPGVSRLVAVDVDEAVELVAV